jgi:hypothetical protein
MIPMREGLSRTGQEKLHVSTRVDPWIVDRLDDLWSPRGICSKAALLLEAVLEHSAAPSIEVLLDDILRTHRPVAPREHPDGATTVALRRLIRGAGQAPSGPRPSLRALRRPPPRRRVSARISAKAHARLTALAHHVGASRGAAMILGALATAFHAQAFDTVMLKLHMQPPEAPPGGAGGARIAS